jgi:hypothetical protein
MTDGASESKGASSDAGVETATTINKNDWVQRLLNAIETFESDLALVAAVDAQPEWTLCYYKKVPSGPAPGEVTLNTKTKSVALEHLEKNLTTTEYKYVCIACLSNGCVANLTREGEIWHIELV